LVKWRFSLTVFISLAALAVSGCATAPSATGPAVQYDPNKPQTRLVGANVEHAKSVAMGAAVTKGWKITQSSDYQLVLQRPLKPGAAPTIAGAQAPGSAPPVVQVETDFFQRPGGVDVVLGADLITNEGTKDESRQDFTETYRDDLMRSLASLQQAWAATSARVASATPPVQSPADLGAPPTAEESQEIAQTEGAGRWGPTEWSNAPTPAAEPPTSPENTAEPVYSDAPAPAPVDDRSGADNMLVLNDPAGPGVWAYYAEHFAKARGCVLAGEGATLVEKQPEYEVHRVSCKSGQEFLLRCNAGTCEEMR
jgi:starvation-inducible outer membrane lipoprotein